MPKCMKTGRACTLNKKYKIAQLGDTAGEVKVQLLSPSLTLPLNSNPGTNKRTLCTVLYLCVGLFQMQTAKVTVYGS